MKRFWNETSKRSFFPKMLLWLWFVSVAGGEVIHCKYLILCFLSCFAHQVAFYFAEPSSGSPLFSTDVTIPITTNLYHKQPIQSQSP